MTRGEVHEEFGLGQGHRAIGRRRDEHAARNPDEVFGVVQQGLRAARVDEENTDSVCTEGVHPPIHEQVMRMPEPERTRTRIIKAIVQPAVELLRAVALDVLLPGARQNRFEGSQRDEHLQMPVIEIFHDLGNVVRLEISEQFTTDDHAVAAPIGTADKSRPTLHRLHLGRAREFALKECGCSASMLRGGQRDGVGHADRSQFRRGGGQSCLQSGRPRLGWSDMKENSAVGQPPR